MKKVFKCGARAIKKNKSAGNIEAGFDTIEEIKYDAKTTRILRAAIKKKPIQDAEADIDIFGGVSLDDIDEKYEKDENDSQKIF